MKQEARAEEHLSAGYPDYSRTRTVIFVQALISESRYAHPCAHATFVHPVHQKKAAFSIEKAAPQVHQKESNVSETGRFVLFSLTFP